MPLESPAATQRRDPRQTENKLTAIHIRLGAGFAERANQLLQPNDYSAQLLKNVIFIAQRTKNDTKKAGLYLDDVELMGSQVLPIDSYVPPREGTMIDDCFRPVPQRSDSH